MHCDNEQDSDTRCNEVVMVVVEIERIKTSQLVHQINEHHSLKSEYDFLRQVSYHRENHAFLALNDLFYDQIDHSLPRQIDP